MKSVLKNVKNEHDAYKISLRNLAKTKERDELELKKHDQNLIKRQLQKQRARDEVAERELKIDQFRNQIKDNHTALKTHGNLLEAAQSQYNVYRKKSTEQKNEQSEQERILKTLNKSIERLRKEIADGDKEFASKQIDWVKLRGETEDVRHANQECSERVTRATDTLNAQQTKIRTLSQFISDADEEIRLQRKQYHTIVDEQRTLNQQLIKRNEQLAKLYEQLKLQYSFKEKVQSTNATRHVSVCVLDVLIVACVICCCDVGTDEIIRTKRFTAIIYRCWLVYDSRNRRYQMNSMS